MKRRIQVDPYMNLARELDAAEWVDEVASYPYVSPWIVKDTLRRIAL